MTSQTITIPAREVRPGDVLFGMTVGTSEQAGIADALWFLRTESMNLWIDPGQQVTVERPVPSDPIGTVRAEFVDGEVQDVYLKSGEHEGYWYVDGRTDSYTDAEVADFPILWKPGMPIPTEGGQA